GHAWSERLRVAAGARRDWGQPIQVAPTRAGRRPLGSQPAGDHRVAGEERLRLRPRLRGPRGPQPLTVVGSVPLSLFHLLSSSLRSGPRLPALAIFLVGGAAINWTVNPYGAWRTDVVHPLHRPSRITETEVGERVVTAYRIRAERPTTLLVGSSRVLNGMPVE